jgi:hypothetical protein
VYPAPPLDDSIEFITLERLANVVVHSGRPELRYL